MLIILLIIFQSIYLSKSIQIDDFCEMSWKSFGNMIDVLMNEIYPKTRCIVFIFDTIYRDFIQFKYMKNFLTPYYTIFVHESESFSPPRQKVHSILSQSKNSGCNVYIILIANGLQVVDLLQHAERVRLINNQGYFLLMHDKRLFDTQMTYMWNRIVNVLFIKQLRTIKTVSNSEIIKTKFHLEYIRYPAVYKNIITTYYLDTWYKEKFRFGSTHFVDKTRNLMKKKLKVAVFEHIPAVTQHSRALFDDWQKSSDKALGIEFEIMRMVAEKINFIPAFYHPKDIETLRWGDADEKGQYNGLLGEAEQARAAFLLGDLHYTLRHQKILDLTVPYNTECLTFLTPESITQNSWELLIVPFTLYTWIALISTVLLAAIIIRIFSLIYERHIFPSTQKTQIFEMLKGLSLFTQIENCLLHTCSILLQVSLPRLPRVWALRIFIGWWWFYCILVTVTYRASITAVLARPMPRVTIDTLDQLARSTISVGSWGADKREFFLSTVDGNLNKIGNKFELTTLEDDAIAKVANGTFGYYENIHVLQEARAKRQVLEALQKSKASESNTVVVADRALHIMRECVIHMPISIGMDRNSPLKPQVDNMIQLIVETGLTEKWLSDITEWSKITEIKYDTDDPKALMDLKKLHGALVALGLGYFFSLLALIGEKLYWKYIVLRDPTYDKYQMDTFYALMKQNRL